MTQGKANEWSKGVKLLSLLLAALVWLSVVLERPGELNLRIPVQLERMPAGLWLDSPPPAELDVVVRGPRILLVLLDFQPVRCTLDLTGAAPGPVSVAPTDSSFDLNHELKVVRMFPATVPLVLSKLEQQ